jgi:hypothetical protein
MIIRAGLIKIKIFLEIPSRVSPARLKLRDFYLLIMEEKEIWKTVIGFEDYQVSSLGRVKSLKFGRKKILKPSKSKKGYSKIYLSNKTHKKRIPVHQLIAITFLNHVPCGFLKVVDHIDNNPSNNTLSNLQIVTNRINSSKNTKNIYSKLTGVTFNKNINKYVSLFKAKNKKYHLGYFNNEEEAHKKYIEAVNNFEKYGIIPNVRIKASKYKGVCSNGKGGFYSHIRVNGKTVYLGFYKTEDLAYKARLKALSDTNIKI